MKTGTCTLKQFDLYFTHINRSVFTNPPKGMICNNIISVTLNQTEPSWSECR